jgi:FkbM family methyltransferase
VTNPEKRNYRENTPFWRDDQLSQNFGDFITAYLFDRLFLRIPRRPGDIRIIGSYLDDYLVDIAVRRPLPEGISQRASLIAWAGGLREPGGLSNAALEQVEVLSVRGPLTASELRLGDHFPQGDPGLLMPALYSPSTASDFVGKSVCIPHFNDDRTDDQIKKATQADCILRPSIGKSFNEIELLIDRLTSANFVLCGSLHGAILAAAYQVPFAFWDSGRIDIPFKWHDFAESVRIPCKFLPDVSSGRRYFEAEIRDALTPIPMWDALANAPYPIRPEAILKILAFSMARTERSGADTVGELVNIFERYRHRADEIVEDSSRLIDELAACIEVAQSALESAKKETGEVRGALEAARRDTEEVRGALEAARRDTEEVRGALEAARRDTAALVHRNDHSISVLTRGGELLAEELRRTAARPWRPLKRAIQSGALKFALLFQGVLSDRTVTRLRRSLAKRKPRSFIYSWQATVARAWNAEAPVDPLVMPVVRAARAPFGSRLVHRVLLALAAISAPFSRRRADRFRRSAEKRDPFRFRPKAASNPLSSFSRVELIGAGSVADTDHARRILVADYRLPRPDLSAGEKATFGLIADLCEIGFEVTFLPTDMVDVSPYREALETLGVTVITRESGYPYGGDYIRAEGQKFGAFYFIRVDVAEALLPSARSVAPDARVIFHAPDLYFLRELRGAELAGDAAALEKAEQTKTRETAIMRASDHVVLVSPAEVPLLADVLPRSRISVFPALYSPVVAAPAGFAGRNHIFFLGGFKHPPNVDAVRWFVETVWPSVHAQLPEAEFHILGAEAPEEVIALGSQPGVRFVGYVKDLDPILAEYRLSVAPLLYGAGIKGKLGMAMGAGIPCVSTTIGAEGMGILDGVHALVRDEPGEFAKAVVALYSDQALWERISVRGRQLVEDRFGDAANQSAFYRVLDDAGALPMDMYVAWCQAAEPAPLPAPDPAEAVDVSIIVPVHNQWALTRACLNSVLRAIRGSGITCEVILADDGSTDETLLAASVFPGLQVVRQERNLGFLGNCNAAAAEARGEALLFLNNDTVVLPGWLTELVRVLREEPSAAIVGSKLLYPDGTIQETGGVLFSDASAGNLGRGKPRRDPLFSFDREVDYATGASILVRRSFWDSVGGFDVRYSPAYCEDSDLAMAARHNGMRVICAARSEVVHFEHGTYGEAVAAAPKALALKNAGLLREKWAAQFAQDHLDPTTQPEVAAAHAEREPFSLDRARRQSGKLNILYFSPFPSHPQNHGNQATIHAFARRFQSMGHKVHFALLQSSMYDAAAAIAMRETWDSFDILPNSHPLGADGREIPFDGWYEPGLGENIRLLCDRYDIDVVFCSYIFQSKLLEFVPAHVLKVIDTHDKMGDRYEMLRKNGQPLEFFSCTPEQEGAYLRRADVVVARRAQEAEYFNSVSQRQTAIVIPHFEEPRFQQRQFEALRNVGLVASANRINLAIMLDFVRAVDKATIGGKVPFQVYIAGQVRDMIRDLPQADQAAFGKDWITLHGFVPDIADFYAQMDLVVSPVTMGTGINVKTVQAMAFGMPLLTTAWGSKGIETGDPMHGFATLDDLVGGLMEVQSRPEVLEHLAHVSSDRYQAFITESLNSLECLFAHEKLVIHPQPVGTRSVEKEVGEALFDDLRVRVEQAVARFHAGALQDSDFISDDQITYALAESQVRDMVEANGMHDPDFVLYRHFDKSMGTILDIGANTGYSVISMRSSGCDCPILSFEVVAAYEPVLAELKRLLPPGTYDYIMSGVGVRGEKLTFYAPVVNRRIQTALNTSRPESLHRWFVDNVVHDARMNHSTEGKLDFAFRVSIGVIDSLDNLLNSRRSAVDIHRIAAIKVDVEGMEADVLLGGRETILRDLPFLMLEGGNRDPKVAAVLDEFGYRMAERHGESLIPAIGKSSQVNGFFYHERHETAYREKGLLVNF